MKRVVSTDTKRDERVPPGQHTTKKLPVLHYGRVPRIDPMEWRFRIFGLVDKEVIIDLKQFLSLPMVEVYSDIHCVTTWSRLDNTWEGVPATAIKDLVEVRPEATHVMVHCYGGYTTNLPLDEFFDDDVLLAVKHEGAPITLEHGAPVRLVVPKLYFWKSAKWVNGLEFMDQDSPGFWEQRGYHIHGDPWTEERYSD